MALKFTVHTSGFDAIMDQLSGACTKAEHIVAEQAAKDTEPFVPMRTGSLRQRTRVVGNQIVYPGPYARYLYYGKLMVDPGTGSPYARKGVTKVLASPERNLKFWHPGTRSHWFEVSKNRNIKKWLRVADKAVKHEL